MDNSKATILVVDDDLVSLTLLCKMVGKQNYNVVQATDSDKALKAIHEQAIDLVIADYDMPGMNGLELLRKVKAEYPRLPFILVTAYSNIRVIRDAWYAGAFDFFQKPVFVDRLHQTIRLGVEYGHLTVTRGKFPRLEMMQPDPEVLNVGVVRELAVAIEREDLNNVVLEFETHVRADLDHVIRFSLAKKSEEVRKLCHRMAGTSVNLGLVKFSKEMHEIELNPTCDIRNAKELHALLDKSLHWLQFSIDQIRQDLAA